MYQYFRLTSFTSLAVALLSACANLLAGIRFIGDMMNSPGETLEYEFKAKLDLSGLHPSINIHEIGDFNLSYEGAQ